MMAPVSGFVVDRIQLIDFVALVANAHLKLVDLFGFDIIVKSA